MKTMNYSLIRILFALVIGLVLVLWPNAAASYKTGECPGSPFSD